jgi:hypothetical protein
LGKTLTVTSRKVSSRAAVARHKRDVFRKELTQETCGTRRKELAATSRGMTHCAGVARRRGDFIGKDQTGNNVARGAPRERTPGKRCRVDPEGSTGIKDSGARRQLRLRNKNTGGQIGNTFRLEIAK